MNHLVLVALLSSALLLQDANGGKRWVSGFLCFNYFMLSTIFFGSGANWVSRFWPVFFLLSPPENIFYDARSRLSPRRILNNISSCYRSAKKILRIESLDTILSSIRSGDELGTTECKRQFHNQKWNCSTTFTSANKKTGVSSIVQPTAGKLKM